MWQQVDDHLTQFLCGADRLVGIADGQLSDHRRGFAERLLAHRVVWIHIVAQQQQAQVVGEDALHVRTPMGGHLVLAQQAAHTGAGGVARPGFLRGPDRLHGPCAPGAGQARDRGVGGDRRGRHLVLCRPAAPGGHERHGLSLLRGANGDRRDPPTRPCPAGPAIDNEQGGMNTAPPIHCVSASYNHRRGVGEAVAMLIAAKSGLRSPQSPLYAHALVPHRGHSRSGILCRSHRYRPNHLRHHPARFKSP